MRERFSKTNPPEFVEYRGYKYRLKKAAMPVKQAEQKLAQVARAVDRIGSQGASADLIPTQKGRWDINPSNLLDSVGKRYDEPPYLIMWNPLSAELMLAEESDFRFHMDMYEKYSPSLVSYPGANYDDWVRGYVVEDKDDEVRVWEWLPLYHFLSYFSPREYQEATSFHRRGARLFEKMLAAKGASSVSVNPARLEDR